MEYKYLGNTGVALPAIGIGTYKYKGGVESLRQVIQLGPCLIDTAENYGTETTVGKAMKGLRDQVLLSTKVWPTHFRRTDVIESAENSLRRLQTDYIDLYQLHWPNPRIPIAETMEAMESLVDAGKVRFIGVSNFSRRQLQDAVVSMTKHPLLFNQVPYSLINREIDRRLLPYCRTNDITVVAYSPLGGTLKDIEACDKRGVLRRIADEIGKTPGQVALNWCISKDNVVAIPKANSFERMAEDLGAMGWRLSAEQIRLLESGIREPRSRLERTLRGWARRCLEVTGVRTPMHKLEVPFH